MTPRLPLLVLGLSALGACATNPQPAPDGPALASSADRHQIAVEQSAQTFEIAVGPNDHALTQKARDDLRAFASQYLRTGHGALIVSRPAGGANEDAAHAVAGEARRWLGESGVASGAVAMSTYDASGNFDSPVMLSFTRFEARAPECAPLWEQDLAHQSNNQPWESFGCSTQANLAAMIEDPRDLLTPRASDPRDSGRRDTVMGAYRQGQPTGAERSDDEHVTISDVAQ